MTKKRPWSLLCRTHFAKPGEASVLTNSPWFGPEHPSVGESASNGYAERGVQLFEDVLRTWPLVLQHRTQQAIPIDHPVLTWLMEHVSNLINKYHTGADGLTPYARLHGHDVDEELVEFDPAELGDVQSLQLFALLR